MPLGTSKIQKEIRTIKYLAASNNIHLNIEKMIRRKSISETLNFTTSLPRSVWKKREKWIKLPYLGKYSYKLNRILRPYGFKSVHYNSLILQQFFGRVKDNTPREERSGVYRIECRDCYIYIYMPLQSLHSIL